MANKLSDAAREVTLAAMSAIYQPDAVKMFQDQLAQGKGEKAIAPSVALAAISILQQLGPKGASLSEDEMWGKHGVVHSLLDALFELAKELGYKAPASQLQTAYEIVDHEIEKSGFGDGPQAAQGQQDPQQSQQGAPQPQGGDMMAQAAMGGMQ